MILFNLVAMRCQESSTSSKCRSAAYQMFWSSTVRLSILESLTFWGLLKRDGLQGKWEGEGERDRTEHTCSSPIALIMVTKRSFPSSNWAWMSFPRSDSGTLTSSLGTPSLVMRLRKPSSMLTYTQNESNRKMVCAYVTHKLVFVTLHVGNIHIVGGRTDIFL